MSFVTDIGDPKLQFQWDSEVLQFIETLEYHGHEKTMNLLRGPGFLGTGKGGQKEFDWTSWNCPIVGKTTRKKKCTGYTTDRTLQDLFEEEKIHVTVDPCLSASTVPSFNLSPLTNLLASKPKPRQNCGW